MRGRDARPEYARSSDFRFGNATLIPPARVFSFPVILFFLFLFPPLSSLFSRLLLFLRSDGNMTRAGAGRYRSLHGHQQRADTLAHALTQGETDTHACTHTCTHKSTLIGTRVRKKLRVELTAGHRIVGSSRSSVVIRRVRKRKCELENGIS